MKTKGERRAAKRAKKIHGMKVRGRSVLVLARVDPRKKGKR